MEFRASKFDFEVGNVGIGTTSPGWPLTVYYASNVGPGATINDTTPQNGNTFLQFKNNGTTAGLITSNGTTTTTYGTTSDRRLKENIADTKDGLNKVGQIKVHDFNFISDPSKTRVQGFIAQELYETYPFAVGVGGPDPKIKPWSVDYGRLTPLLVKAVQELKADNDNLRAEFEAYKHAHP
jgi:hypothetical protein